MGPLLLRWLIMWYLIISTLQQSLIKYTNFGVDAIDNIVTN